MATIRVQYTTQEDRANEITTYTGQGYHVIEEQLYEDGNYLIFSNDTSALDMANALAIKNIKVKRLLAQNKIAEAIKLNGGL